MSCQLSPNLLTAGRVRSRHRNFAIRSAMYSNSSVLIDPQPSVFPGQALSADYGLCQYGGKDGSSAQARYVRWDI